MDEDPWLEDVSGHCGMMDVERSIGQGPWRSAEEELVSGACALNYALQNSVVCVTTDGPIRANHMLSLLWSRRRMPGPSACHPALKLIKDFRKTWFPR